MEEYVNIPKKKGLVYRGMSYQEFMNAESDNFFKSYSLTSLGTYASDDPYTAECYAEYLAPEGKISSLMKSTYVVAFNKNNLQILNSKDIDGFIKFCKKLKIVTEQYPVLYWQSLFKKYVSGDDHLIIGKIPFNSAKEIYQFTMEKWVKIK